MTLTVVSDWHIGAHRSAGTTPATAYQLRQDLLGAAQQILQGTTGNLLVNGDLFDGPDIPRADMLMAVRLFNNWLEADRSRRLWLSNGNHDLDKNATRLSAFQFFAQLLVSMHPEQVEHITTGQHLRLHDAWVIPHMPNQDLFEIELAKVPACRFLFVHCNYDNQFAVEQDHSLNLSREWAEKLPVEYIVFGHEHQGRTELGGKVVIVGNQFPSSVSDCLGHQSKTCLMIAPDMPLVFPMTWNPDGDFAEMDWRELEDTGARFIRVTGQAAAAEAPAVVNAIARFRAKSEALVITNAVKIEGVNDSAQLELSHEQIQAFDVLSALLELLSPAEGAKVLALMQERESD